MILDKNDFDLKNDLFVQKSNQKSQNLKKI